MNNPLPVFTDFVDGRSIAADQKAVGLDLIAPQSGQTIAVIAESGKAGVDRAVAAAMVAFATHRKQPTHQRIAWLKVAADALRNAGDEIAALICEDVGKPIRMARFEVRRGAEFLELTAAALTQLGGETLPLDITAPGAGHFGFARHVPYGVVAAITPFNAPVNLLVQKIAPAIAAGNALIAKPAIAGTRTALRIAQLLDEAGWPKGLFSVVTGDRETAIALASHRDVRAVSFTGGTVAGDALASAAGAKKIRRRARLQRRQYRAGRCGHRNCREEDRVCGLRGERAAMHFSAARAGGASGAGRLPAGILPPPRRA